MNKKEIQKTKEMMIKNFENKIKNKVKPSLEYDEGKGTTHYWLSGLWDLAFTSGELSGIAISKQILNADLNELTEIEEFGELNIKNKTLQ